jgi:hypothetical protein
MLLLVGFSGKVSLSKEKGQNMPQVTNKKASEYIASRKPFTANTMRGEMRSGGEYRIYSYSTLMAVVEDEGITHLNNQYYSQTTSRHQTFIRQGLSGFTLSPDAVVLER